MTDERGVWVYAVGRAIETRWLDCLTGLAGEPVRAVTAAGLTAAVTSVGLAEFGEDALRRQLEDLAWLEAAARAHHLVIDAVASRGPAVPMRLATVYRDDAGVAELLAARRADFATALERVTARAEWGVKVFAGGGDDPVAAAPAAARGNGPGAAYLNRRRQELIAAQEARRAAAASAEEIHAALAALAAAAELRAPQPPQLSGQATGMILNGAYLVDDGESAVFTATVNELAARHPAVRVELTGPWPPYSFATPPELQTAP